MLSLPALRAISTSRLNSGGSETMRLVRMSEMMPMGILMKKTQRQEKLSVIHPPSGGPIAGAVTIAMLYSAKAAARLSAGNVSTRMACSTGANPLQHAEENQPAQARRESAQERGEREHGHATHVVVLAAEDAAEPRTER